LEQEELILHPTIEAILSVFDATTNTLDGIVEALSGEMYDEAQPKALGNPADAAVLLASDTIKAIVEVSTAYDDGFDEGYDVGEEDGYEEGYNEATDDLIEAENGCCDFEGTPTQVFQCPVCDKVTDRVLLSSETGDKLCPRCGSAMIAYDLDYEDDDETVETKTTDGTNDETSE
jgi:hypothetical protein